MVRNTVFERDLDEFTQVAPLRGDVLVEPDRLHRFICGAALIVALALSVSGVTLVVNVFSSAVGSPSETFLLGLGGFLFAIGGGLAWRFLKPFVFAVLAAEDMLMWRTPFGWISKPWREVEFVMVRPHTVFGARKVYIKAGAARLQYGWHDITDWYTLGPWESFPAEEAKALTHAIVQRAGLQRREPGVWVRDDYTAVSTGVVEW
ncbi:MAG: hypothetical protein NZL91_07955 [Thermoflexales bacterium]|nr:hypothetical protein [Thermoflexales bacterium]MCX7938804.1 hypothetical protein [Thermoflexales bacterium]MDW8053524.1 hypothetical protein [Anaerolineae bacterium]MDW8292180.1 hypothetical protein [Anaerolineae bacterium]